MIEREGDLWILGAELNAAVVVTTNGSVRRDGCAVMGRGCALEAKTKYPGIDARLGNHIRAEGNHVFELQDVVFEGISLFSFPVKHAWNEDADIVLIGQSARELVNICDSLSIGKVVLPRPGCGNGRLRWEKVKSVLKPILDDRFVVVHRKWEV